MHTSGADHLHELSCFPPSFPFIRIRVSYKILYVILHYKIYPCKHRYRDRQKWRRTLKIVAFEGHNEVERHDCQRPTVWSSQKSPNVVKSPRSGSG